MSGTYVSTRYNNRIAEDYSNIIFSRVIYDHNLPVMQLMSVAEALRQRKVDALRINILTERAKRTLEQINGR